jgi:hypothetical protein
VAVKIGDVNNTAQANVNTIIPRSGSNKIIWSTFNQEYSKDEVFEIPLKINREDSIHGFQFTISCPDLEFIEAYSTSCGLNEDDYALFGDKITFSWFDEKGKSFSENDETLILKARAKTNNNLNCLSINSDIAEAEMYLMTDEIIIPQLEINQLDDQETPIILQPNPWTSSATIKFDLDDDSQVSVDVFDLNGRALHHQEGFFVKGNNSISLSSKDFTEKGLLIYSITTNAGKHVEKMIVNP